MQHSLFRPWTILILAIVFLALTIVGIRIVRQNTEFPPAQTGEPKKVGVLQVFSTTDNIYLGFKEEMARLGYIEGKDIVYDYQNWNQDPSRIKDMVQAFIENDVDLIFAIAHPSVDIASEMLKKAGKDTPVLFTFGENILASGLVESYGSSGNNVTGVLSSMAELVPKQLEFLKRIDPDAKTVGVFSDGFMYPGGPGEAIMDQFIKHSAQFGITVIEYTSDAPPGPDLQKAFEEIAAEIDPNDIDALYHVPGHFILDQQDREIKLGKRIGAINIMPVVEELEESGGVLSYSFDLKVTGGQIAVMADKIFRGAKPSEIPIEWPRKDVVAVNTESARQIGITIPDSVLLLVDQIIRE